jgi:hypothetical protein
VLRDPKIRYEGNNQDYSLRRKLDDQLIGKDADVAINIITTDHYAPRRYGRRWRCRTPGRPSSSRCFRPRRA